MKKSNIDIIKELQGESADCNDFALALAWPETTARGDEKWYLTLKKIGIVKNLNFKVGHAAVILIEKDSGRLHYYDFGRYVTPRGYGRARSALSDPKLELETICSIAEEDSDKQILVNLSEIIEELESKKADTHGDGPLYFSIVKGINFERAKRFADTQVRIGSVRYSAFKNGNNNCSRFVQQVLLAGLDAKSKLALKISQPESFVASPISNVVNGSPENEIFICENGQITNLKMSRIKSRTFFLRMVWANISSKHAKKLPSDNQPGYTDEPDDKPEHIPDSANWLGGIGEGGWYHLYKQSDTAVVTAKYDIKGRLEYEIPVTLPKGNPFNSEEDFRFVHDSHAHSITLEQNGKKIRLYADQKDIKIPQPNNKLYDN